MCGLGNVRKTALIAAAIGLVIALVGGLALAAVTSAKENPQVEASKIAKQENLGKRYNIVYYLHGGKADESSPTTIRADARISTASLGTPTRKGYEFMGWFATASRKIAKSYVYGDPQIERRTVHAKWKKKTYTITYNANEGTVSEDAPSTYTVTSTVKLPTPTRNAYDFKGWYSDEACTKQVESIPKGSTGNITLYAKWEHRDWDSVYYSQSDTTTKWYNDKYWGGATIKKAGCGLVVYTMAIDMLTGQDIDPGEMNKLRGGKKHCWKGSDATPDSTKGALKGLTHAEWTEQTFGVSMKEIESDVDVEYVQRALEAGHVFLLARGGNKCFKKSDGKWYYHGGHYNILYRYDAETETFYMHDPNGGTPGSKKRKLKTCIAYSAKDLKRCLTSRDFSTCEMYLVGDEISEDAEDADAEDSGSKSSTKK